MQTKTRVVIGVICCVILILGAFAVGYSVGNRTLDQTPPVKDPLAYNDGLQSAACDGLELRVRAYIKQGFDLNGRRQFICFNPLVCATIHNQAGVVRILLEAGADRNVKDCRGRTPLEIATFQGNQEIVHLLQTVQPRGSN